MLPKYLTNPNQDDDISDWFQELLQMKPEETNEKIMDDENEEEIYVKDKRNYRNIFYQDDNF